MNISNSDDGHPHIPAIQVKQRPKLSYADQILHLEKKGVTFNRVSKAEAVTYLMETNNLFKLSSYRKNYNKEVTGERYLNLDFSQLVDLATIDTRLRTLVLEMALSIEHFAKVKLLKRITLSTLEDGYSIVNDYLSNLCESYPKGYSHLINEIARNGNGPYCNELFKSYHTKMPVWAFLELIPFGSFISFYKFCADRFIQYDHHDYLLANDKQMQDEFYMLLDIKHLRNAAAHNNCILNDLKTKKKTTKKKSNLRLTRALSNIGTSSTTRSRKLANERIAQILTCFFMFTLIVKSPGSRKHFAESMQAFKLRLFRDNSYSTNILIKSTFELFQDVIDNWFHIL